MRVLFVSSEAYPLAKTGGLADVSAALPMALADLGVDVRLVMPGYNQALSAAANKVTQAKLDDPGPPTQLVSACMPDTGLPVWLVDCPSLFRRSGGPYQDEAGQDWPDNVQRFSHFSQIAPEAKRQVAELVAEAEQVHLSDPAFRDELRHWLLQRRGEGHEAMREAYARMGSPAGHTPQSRHQPDLSKPTAAAIARQFATVTGASNHQRALVEASPVIALLTTTRDTTTTWLAVGQALQHLLLTATIAGVSASYLNPPIEIVRLRPHLAQAFGTKGKPQVLLRLGHGRAISPTPRRPMSEVVRCPTPS